jgi:hypothetical protein
MGVNDSYMSAGIHGGFVLLIATEVVAASTEKAAIVSGVVGYGNG